MVEQATSQSKEATAGIAPAESLPVSAEKPNGFFSSVSADLVAGGSSAVAGGLQAWRIIQERAHKNMSSLRLTDDIKDARTKHGNELREKIASGALTKEESYHALKDAKILYESKMNARFEKAGVQTITEKFGLLRGHQKSEVIFSALTTIGVVFGSILFLRYNIAAEKDHKALAKKGKDDQGAGR